jgi:arylsulfatase A-like enzyme
MFKTSLAAKFAFTIALLLFSMVVFLKAGRADELPNIVIINIDDLGYADIEPFGSKLNRTPHLNRMAAEGMCLRSHYAAPVCSPSRSALMTGCYPKRVLPIPTVLFPAATVGLNPNETTIAEVLKTKGYATACIGKWHLGDQPPFMPTSQGFDYYFGIPYSNDMGLAAEGSKSNYGEPLPQRLVKEAAQKKAATDKQSTNEIGMTGSNQPPLPLVRNLEVYARVDAKGQENFTRQYTEEAVKFIQANTTKPFFLYLPHNAVHFPIYPSDEFRGHSKNGLLGDWVEEVDWSVGQVLDTLRSAKLDANTFVFFTSDNGGTPRSDNTPLRGHKGSTWEGGMRVPTIAWYPGKIPSGKSTDQITSMMDLVPTVAALTGASLPEKKIDGGNLWPILSGQPGATSPHDVFFYFKGLNLEAVRHGSMKLHLTAPAAGKAEKAHSAGPALYDLTKDISESNNLAESHPEIVSKLTAIAHSMDDDLGIKVLGPGCRSLGRVDEAKPWIAH